MKKEWIELLYERGSTRHNWIEPSNHEKIWKEFEAEGITLPAYCTLNRKSLERNDLRILTDDYIISFKYWNRKKKQYDFWTIEFYKGFIWDLASVPRFLRGIIENDSYEMRLAAMIHDVMFGLHLETYRYCNKVFYHNIRERGGKILRAMLAFLGVSTPVGKIVYNQYKPKDHWMKNFVKATKNDKVIWDKGLVK